MGGDAMGLYDRGNPAMRLIAKIVAGAILAPMMLWGCAGGGAGGDESNSATDVGNTASGLIMTAPRADQSATTLANGKILIAGGVRTEAVNGMLASAELYDPANPGFAPTGRMTTEREGQTATLLHSGKALIAGGIRNFGFRETLRSAELYDPASGIFTSTGSMANHRQGHTATLLNDGRVLIAGGRGDGQQSLASAELYNPATGRFSSAGQMNYARESHAATLLPNGQVLITGGGMAGQPQGYITLQNSELYDPPTGTFINIAPMLWQRAGHSSTLLRNGLVLIAGGRRVLGLNSAELYDPETRSFRPTGAMMLPHYLHTATLLRDGRVLIAGGWDVTGPSPVGRADAELYDPSSGTFSETGRMNTPRLDQSASLLPDGRVLIAGGVDGNGNVTAGCELYSPSTGFFVLSAADGAPDQMNLHD
jgi:hypothetical protein